MVSKTLKITSGFVTKSEGDEDKFITIEGYANTSAVDRVADQILTSAWSANGGLNNYKANPIILFNHDYDKPIGVAEEIRADTKGLYLKCIISKEADEKVYNLVKSGILKAFSVRISIKDASYDNDVFTIKDVELLEVSVVSVPCNPESLFSVAKSLENAEDLNLLKNADAAATPAPKKGRKMEPEDVNKTVADAVAKALADAEAVRVKEAAEAASRAKAMEDAAKAAQEKIDEAVAKAVSSINATSEERIVAEVAKRLEEGKTLQGELSAAVKENGDAIKTFLANQSKSGFFPSAGQGSEALSKQLEAEVTDAYLLSKIMKKGFDETKFGKSVIEKANAHSSVRVTDQYETTASTKIEMDIQNALVLAPLFREVQMPSALMILPVAPDSGYAELTTGAGSGTGAAPNGTLDARGGTNRDGIPLTEVQLRTIKLISKAYIGNETEEDAIIPVLGLIKDSMLRQHVRGVENMILLAGHADGEYASLTTGAQGLLKYATTQSRSVTAAGTSTPLTAAALLNLRKNMGKYGVNENDVTYIVSQTGYFELLEDPEFQDFNLVQGLATKLTGQVGLIYGSKVMLCDEFPTAATGKFHALAVNTRNFLVPRQRGVTNESQYFVTDQASVLVTSQRLGFTELIPNARAVIGLKYA